VGKTEYSQEFPRTAEKTLLLGILRDCSGAGCEDPEDSHFYPKRASKHAATLHVTGILISVHHVR
jgi:hypothetical protein